MAFDGYGNFLRLYSWVMDATNSVKIRADRHDDEDNGFAAGLSNCITKDGQTSVTQNIPLNSRRIISLADPIDPQDAATKDYTDTKMPLDGSVPITGNVTITKDNPTLTLNGTLGTTDSIFGDKGGKHRWQLVLGNASPETGSNAGSDLNLIGYADDGTTSLGSALNGIRSSGLLSVKADPTTALGISTKQYADASSGNKLPLAGGTITGNLAVNGELTVIAGYLRFTTPGGAGYIQWNGGGNYALGGGGTIWHSGNFNPATGVVTNVQLAIAGDFLPIGNNLNEPFPGAVASMVTMQTSSGGTWVRLRYVQIKTGSTWYTVSYA